jgi:hypothetical protein
MATIGLAILSALYEGLSRFGLAQMGIPYPEEPTLGPVDVNGNRRPRN